MCDGLWGAWLRENVGTTTRSALLWIVACMRVFTTLFACGPASVWGASIIILSEIFNSSSRGGSYSTVARPPPQNPLRNEYEWGTWGTTLIIHGMWTATPRGSLLRAHNISCSGLQHSCPSVRSCSRTLIQATRGGGSLTE